jgi:hypothetical protein
VAAFCVNNIRGTGDTSEHEREVKRGCNHRYDVRLMVERERAYATKQVEGMAIKAVPVGADIKFVLECHGIEAKLGLIGSGFEKVDEYEAAKPQAKTPGWRTS